MLTLKAIAILPEMKLTQKQSDLLEEQATKRFCEKEYPLSTTR
jgi:hypothetical protein